MQDCRPLFSLLKMASKSKKVKKSKASDKKEKSLQEKVFVDSVPYSEPEENDDQLLMRSLIEFENTGKCTWLHSPAPGVLRSNLPTVLHLPSDSQDTRLNVGLETQYDDFELRQPLITALMPGPASGKPYCYISNNEVHIINFKYFKERSDKNTNLDNNRAFFASASSNNPTIYRDYAENALERLNNSPATEVCSQMSFEAAERKSARYFDIANNRPDFPEKRVGGFGVWVWVWV